MFYTAGEDASQVELSFDGDIKKNMNLSQTGGPPNVLWIDPVIFAKVLRVTVEEMFEYELYFRASNIQYCDGFLFSKLVLPSKSSASWRYRCIQPCLN